MNRARLKFLAGQFARPSGLAGRLFIGGWLDRISRGMNRMTFEQLDVRASDGVLEVGFGGGELIEWILAATEARVVGVDLSEAMLKRARRRFRKVLGDGRLRLFLGSAEALPLEDGSIDKACSVNSLYFWPDPAAGMVELARVLRPGGRLVLCLETPEALRAWPGHVYGFRLLAAEEASGLMEKAGFRKLDIRHGEAAEVGEYFCLSGERGHG